jgi:hypothetical protein
MNPMIIPLDAQMRMADHLKRCGWTLTPPNRFGPAAQERMNKRIEHEAKIDRKNKREGPRVAPSYIKPDTHNYRILEVLEDAVENYSSQDIKQRLGWEKSPTSRMSELRQGGFVAVSKLATNGTAPNRYYITPEGRTALDEARGKAKR